MTGRERDELRRRIVVRDPTVCHHCSRKGLTPEDRFCPDCGFPQGGTELEQRQFMVRKRMERSKVADHEAMVKKARMYLLVAAGLNMIAFISSEPVVLIIGGIISGVFVALSFWARKRAYPALLTGLLTYISIQLFFGLFNWQFLFSGIFWKVAIVGSMFYALRSAKELEKRATDGASPASPGA